jgi:signal transduction histidine kinase
MQQTLRSIDRQLAGWGVFSILLSLMAPWLLTVDDFGIMGLLYRSMEPNGNSYIIFASIRLVVLNTIRILPLYVGVLLLAEGLGFITQDNRGYLRLLPVLLVPAFYEVISFGYGIHYDLGVPAVSLIFAIIIVNKMQHMARAIGHKVLVFALLLFGLQWLDIVPFLSRFGFGRGEVSLDIKRIGMFINAEEILNFTGFALCIIFVSNAFLIARLLQGYTREIEAVENELRLENLTKELQIRAVENRSLRETQALVHDLKTPLTTIQGLAGVISLANPGRQEGEYADYISEAVDKMNTMIGEFLSDDAGRSVPVNELVQYAVAHLPQLNSIGEFRLELPDDDIKVRVNKVRMSRAIINLLQNALDAVDPAAGRIAVVVAGCEQGVGIAVEDNGEGIRPDHRQRVWEVGFSTKQSSGIGLAFVRDTVEHHGGRIMFTDPGPAGTRVEIFLPRCCEDDHAQKD